MEIVQLLFIVVSLMEIAGQWVAHTLLLTEGVGVFAADCLFIVYYYMTTAYIRIVIVSISYSCM